MPGDYSEELVELIARKLAESLNDPCFAEKNTGAHWESFRAIYRHDATAALNALSSAGRLVPEGSEVREEWGSRVWHLDNPDETYDGPCTREFAEKRIEAHREAEAEFAGWRGRASIIRRRVITTLWTPAESAQEER